MTLEADLRAFTLAGSAVAGKVGARMHPRKLPQQPTLPALTYQRVGALRRNTLSEPDRLPKAVVQIACWGNSPQETYETAQVVRQRLNGVAGTWGATVVESCQLVGDRDLDDPETGRAGVALDFAIMYVEV